MEDVEKVWDTYLRGKRKEKAKEKLILHYLPLVKYVAGRLAVTLPSHIDINDLVSSGVIGLINAIKNFEPKYKTKFETYAIIRIKGAMLDELRALDWVPRSVREKFCSLQKTYAFLEQELGRPARDDEVAEALNISLDELNSLISQEKSVAFLSLNEILNFDEGDKKAVPMIDSLKDPKQKTPFTMAEFNEKKTILVDLINELPEQERIVITLYYYEGLMLKEIGKVLSISESRVSQIHTKAIVRLSGKLKGIDNLKRIPSKTSK